MDACYSRRVMTAKGSKLLPRLVLWIPAAAGMTGVRFPWVSDLTPKKVTVIPGKRSATRNPGRGFGVVTEVGSLTLRGPMLRIPFAICRMNTMLINAALNIAQRISEHQLP